MRESCSAINSLKNLSDDQLATIKNFFSEDINLLFLTDLEKLDDVLSPIHCRYVDFLLRRLVNMINRRMKPDFHRNTGLDFSAQFQREMRKIDELSPESFVVIESTLRSNVQTLIHNTRMRVQELTERADQMYGQSWEGFSSLPQIYQDALVALFSEHFSFSSRISCISCNGGESFKKAEHFLSTLYSREEIWKTFAPDSEFFGLKWIDLEIEGIQNARSWNEIEPKLKGPDEVLHATRGKSLYEWKKTVEPTARLTDVLLPETTKKHIELLIRDYQEQQRAGVPTRLTFLFRGSPGLGKTMCAEAIAKQLDKKILRIQIGEIDQRVLPNLVMFAINRARVTDQVLVFEECERLLWSNYSDGLTAAWMKVIFEEFNGVAIFNLNYRVGEDFLRRVTYHVKFENLSREYRTILLGRTLSSMSHVEVSQSAVEHIAEKFPVPPGFYQQAIQLARSLGCGQVTDDSLVESFKTVCSSQSFKSDEAVEPRSLFASLRVSEDVAGTIDQFINLAKRKTAGEELPFNGGVSAVFYGMPGCGKTMAAEAVAAELKLKFRKTTASEILSPFVGGTEQNIKELFQKSEREKSVVFIDEAEGLLLSREGATRSWERTQVNEFLKQIEEFEGVLIIATNHRDVMDPAFARRFLFHVEFKTPSQSVRLNLWKNWKHLVNLSDMELSSLATEFELTGGEIQNVVKKAFAANQLGKDDLFRFCEQQMSERWGTSSRRLGI